MSQHLQKKSRFKRAVRRHHVKRLKRNRKNYYGGDLIQDDVGLGKVVTTAALCNCPYCGNQRKWHGKTMQERRQDQRGKHLSYEE